MLRLSALLLAVSLAGCGQYRNAETGRVVDAVTGVALAGAEVTISGTTETGASSRQVLMTSQEGRFRTTAGWKAAVATVSAKGYAQSRLSVPVGLSSLKGTIRLQRLARDRAT